MGGFFTHHVALHVGLENAGAASICFPLSASERGGCERALRQVFLRAVCARCPSFSSSADAPENPNAEMSKREREKVRGCVCSASDPGSALSTSSYYGALSTQCDVLHECGLCGSQNHNIYSRICIRAAATDGVRICEQLAAISQCAFVFEKIKLIMRWKSLDFNV